MHKLKKGAAMIEVIEISLDRLFVGEANVRKHLGDISELTASVKKHGVLHPITVRPASDGRYEIVVGSRRVAAAKGAGLSTVPAIVKELDDGEAMVESLVENLQRGDLDVEDEGLAYEQLVEILGGQRKVAKTVGKSQAHISQTLAALTALRKLRSFGIGVSDNQVITRQRKEGKLLPSRHASELEVAFRAPTVAKYLPDEKERTRKYVEVAQAIAPLPRPQAKKVLDRFKLYPDRPISELKAEALAPVDFHTRLAPGLARELDETAQAQGKRAEDVLPEAVRSYVEQQRVPPDVQSKLQEVVTQIDRTAKEAPEKAERITQIATEELGALTKRLQAFPERSRKMEPKFEQLRMLKERGVIPYTIWDFKFRDDYAGDKDFHGNCSPQIVEQCIWRLTDEGDLVVDPMAGSGTAVDVCKRYNRRCIAYDIAPPEDGPDIIQNDSRQIPLGDNSVDMVFIHPPYWNLVTYTRDAPGDFSRAPSPEAFLEMLGQVFSECHRILKSGKYLCVLLGDLIKDGRFVPLTRRAANLAEQIGFTDCGHAVKLAHGEVSRKKSGVIVAELVHTNNLKISHDFVLFLRKDQSAPRLAKTDR